MYLIFFFLQGHLAIVKDECERKIMTMKEQEKQGMVLIIVYQNIDKQGGEGGAAGEFD